jgi:16S rRNA (uracil1498-N3)-methyltransferase
MLVARSAPGEVVGVSALTPTPPAAATVLVGPEGGWTEEEMASAASACRLVSLGGRTIRADAMAIVAMAALFSRWGEY